MRRQFSEQRAAGEIVHVEVTPGIVIVLAAWMLSAAACEGMELGSPRASLAALGDALKGQLAIARRNFKQDSRCIKSIDACPWPIDALLN